ncbi:hypothetical protein [Streptomyces sp. NPDC005877]|uniref:hypothetical protein n=1 Tax=Streptomyces sp. NPDC005877 TaxID=3155346 RepID=UPI0033E02BDD
MHRFTVDYSKDRPDPRVLLNRGLFVDGLPRLIPLCRLAGHKPVVDGYDSTHDDDRARWVACDRCGIRPKPQGCLDPDHWDLGQPYTGPFLPAPPADLSPTLVRQLARKGMKPRTVHSPLPGPWPEHPTSGIGAQVIIGRSMSLGADFKIGSPGSEQVLAAHIGLGPLGAVYVHTENHGRWIQRRLNPRGYNSRETGISIYHGALWWDIWARRDEHRASDPRWMHGNVKIDPRHYFLGKHTATREQHGPAVPGRVFMPDGTSYEVTLKLERWTRGRLRGRKTTTWEVGWSSEAGIPIRNHAWKGNEVFGSGVTVSASSVENGQWQQEACARIAIQCAKDRTRYGYRPPVPEEQGSAR